MVVVVVMVTENTCLTYVSMAVYVANLLVVVVFLVLIWSAPFRCSKNVILSVAARTHRCDPQVILLTTHVGFLSVVWVDGFVLF